MVTTSTSSIKALAEQVAALTESVAHLSARVEQIASAQPAAASASPPSLWAWGRRVWSGTLLAGAGLLSATTAAAGDSSATAQRESRDPAVAMPDPENLRGVLTYHLATLHRIPIIYYAIFSALYVASGISVAEGLDGFAHFAAWVRLLFGIACALAGVGNLLCIALPTLRVQRLMVWPTVGAALAQLALGGAAAIGAGETGILLSRVILWLVIAWAHVAWGRSIRGRISQRAFTLQLLAMAQERADEAEAVEAAVADDPPALATLDTDSDTSTDSGAGAG